MLAPSGLRPKTVVLAISTLACTPAGTAPEPEPASDLRFVDAVLEGGPPAASGAHIESVAPTPAPECHDQPLAELARVSCDGQRILTKFPIHALWNERVANDPTPKVLAAVAELLRQHAEILMVQIVATSSGAAPRDPAAARFELLEARARADAVLKELWRRHGISAERLEAVGQFGRSTSRAAPRWDVSLVITQRARP
jgi:hypothetical protein